MKLKWFVSVMFGVLAAMAMADDVAIVIGVSDYKNLDANKDLQFADEDARLFADTLIKQLKFPAENVLVFTSKPKGDEKLSSAENIVAALSTLPGKMVNPTTSKFVFYYSGHGLNSKDSGPFLAAQDYDPNKPLSGIGAELTAQKISQRLSSLNVNFALAVYDMCRPGLVNSIEATKELNRKFSIEKTNAKLVANIFSTVDGSSYEDPNFGHGVFTYFFCKALTPQETSTFPIIEAINDNGEVTLERVQSYVRKEMAQANNQSRGVAKGEMATAMMLGKLPAFVAGPVEMAVPLALFPRNAYRPRISAVQRYDLFIEQAIEFYESERFVEAATEFAKAHKLRAFGDFQDAWSAFAAGICFERAGKVAEAEDQYRAAIAADPKYADAMNNLGVLLAKRGDVKEAEDQYRAAIAADPKYADAMNNLGVLLAKRGDVKGAEDQFRAAIAADPKFADAMYNLALLLEKRGDLKGAEDQYRAAIAADPKHAKAMNNLALLLEKRGDLKGAEDQYRAAIAADPKYADAMYNLALLLEKRGDLKGAEDQFRAAIAADPKYANAMYNLALLLKNRGDLKGAEDQYRAAIAADPKHAKAMNNLGVLLGKRGDVKGAEDQYRAATKIAPNDGLYHANLADVLLAQGKKDEALKEAKEAQRLGQKDHPVYKKLGIQ